MTLAPTPIPEIGQIVTVRQRRYVVSEIQQSAIPIEVLSKNGNEPQHLVTLSSIEDDALGEALQVIWEIEPDARINEKSGLPDPTGFDSPRRFNAFLNAVRWGAISSADIRSLQAPFRSGITIEDYQLDPLVRAVQMPRANLLIADDVGLGKTIEAGLIVQELAVAQPRPLRAHYLSFITTNSMARSDARQIRPGIPYRGFRSDARAAPDARAAHQSMVALSPPDHFDRFSQARPPYAAVQGIAAGRG